MQLESWNQQKGKKMRKTPKLRCNFFFGASADSNESPNLTFDTVIHDPESPDIISNHENREKLFFSWRENGVNRQNFDETEKSFEKNK